jgi:hypothetical protein
MIQIRALYRQADRLEKQPTDLAAARQTTSYFGDRTLCSFLLNRPVSRLLSLPTTLLSSSVVERSAVNRLVVGSNPTSGAIF